MFHLNRLKDLPWSEEFAVSVSNQIEEVEKIEGHLNLNDLRALYKLHSKPTPQVSSTRVATLYQTWLVNKFTRPNTLADPPIGQLQTTELQTLGADPPSNEVVPSLGEVKDVVAWLKGGGKHLGFAASVRSWPDLAQGGHSTQSKKGDGHHYLERLLQLPLGYTAQQSTCPSIANV